MAPGMRARGARPRRPPRRPERRRCAAAAAALRRQWREPRVSRQLCFAGAAAVAATAPVVQDAAGGRSTSFALLASLLLLLLRLLWCWTDAPACSRYPLAHRTSGRPACLAPGTLVAPPLLSGGRFWPLRGVDGQRWPGGGVGRGSPGGSAG